MKSLNLWHCLSQKSNTTRVGLLSVVFRGDTQAGSNDTDGMFPPRQRLRQPSSRERYEGTNQGSRDEGL